MLTMVTAQNIQSGTLLLPLTDASSGYSVKDIQGLDPVKAELTSTSHAQMDGGELHNSRRGPRNITMKLGLEPDYALTTVAGLRSDLYHFFMPKLPVTFGLYSDGALWGSTDAVVESCENNMFSAEPEVDISLMCYDPDFYGPDPVILSYSTVSDTSTQAIDYEGTSDTGIIFTITFPDVANSVVLYNTRPDQVINITTIQGSFLAADTLIVDSRKGSKSVTMKRGGLVVPSLYFMDIRSTWISLMHGANLFRAYYSGAPVPYTIEYTPRYGGF